jgi:hypothetical protein
MRSLTKLFRSRRPAPIRKTELQWCPSLLTLEDRLTPSTVSSITDSFNGTPIAAGSTIWFNSSFQASGLPKTGTVTIHVEHGMIDFTAGGTPYHLATPNAEIVLTIGSKTSDAFYDVTDNDWDISAPGGGAGDIFMGGLAAPVTTALPGGIKNIKWTADFWTDTPNVTVNWKWAAAVYSNFSGDYNALNVKPVDNKDMCAYHNGDQSDTPEAYKAFVVKGGTGDGGNNFTGGFSGAAKVKATLGDGLQDYPYASSNPLTSIAFNESTVLRAANLDATNGFFQLWYNDEHALALGVGSVTVKTAGGTTTTSYGITPMTGNPSTAHNPAMGTTATSGDQAGNDISGRPMSPSLYISDTTLDPNNRSGDWQWGGQSYAPSDVFGTWKSFSKTVDYTTSTPTVTVNTGIDPVKNNWNLGAGSDAAPAGLTNEGYGAEVRWNLNDLFNQGVLQSGHNYRFYVMVHDGDQNKVGGDAGQASFNYTYPGPAAMPASIGGFVFTDNNFNGVRDFGDGGLAGITVTLTGLDLMGNSVSVTTTTGTDGSYKFNGLAAGTYSLSVPLLIGQGYMPQSPNVGTVDGVGNGTVQSVTRIGSITLGDGDQGITYNFGEQLGG